MTCRYPWFDVMAEATTTSLLLRLRLQLLVAGRDRSVLLRDILRRGVVQDRRAWFRPAQRLISSQRLEHDGFRRCRHRVSVCSAASAAGRRSVPLNN